jgi:hypothetical protein
VWACLARPHFERLPIIVDQQMPVQLLDLLRYFVGEERQVICLPPARQVIVKRLWTCSKIAFWPGGEKLPAPYKDEYELSDAKALAGIIRALEPKLPAAADYAGYPERIFLARGSDQRRRLANHVDVDRALEALDFTILDFYTVPVLEQLKYLRAARCVLVEAGSGIYGTLFCREGTRIGELPVYPRPEREWCAAMSKELGHVLVLFRCAAVAGGFQADLDRLASFVRFMTSPESLPA